MTEPNPTMNVSPPASPTTAAVLAAKFPQSLRVIAKGDQILLPVATPEGLALALPVTVLSNGGVFQLTAEHADLTKAIAAIGADTREALLDGHGLEWQAEPEVLFGYTRDLDDAVRVLWNMAQAASAILACAEKVSMAQLLGVDARRDGEARRHAKNWALTSIEDARKFYLNNLKDKGHTGAELALAGVWLREFIQSITHGPHDVIGTLISDYIRRVEQAVVLCQRCERRISGSEVNSGLCWQCDPAVKADVTAGDAIAEVNA